MPLHQPKSTLRLIVSSHGESLHNIAGAKINTIWDNELIKVKNEVLKSTEETPEVKCLINKQLKKYEDKKEFLSYNLLEKVDYYAYYDPVLTEKGKVQANFCGSIFKTYLEYQNLNLSDYVFSTPYNRTISSMEQILTNFQGKESEIMVIPNLIEPCGRFVDKFSLEKTPCNYKVLNENINPDLIMYQSETDSQISKRIKKGFEKIFKSQKKEPKDTVSLLMCQGGIMRIISALFLKEQVEEIKNPELWDLLLWFDQKGNLESVEFIEKIFPDDFHKATLIKLISEIPPSEEVLQQQDFSVIENALSWLARDARNEIKHILKKQAHKIVKNKNTRNANIRNLKELAKKPAVIKKYAKKKLGELKITKQQCRMRPDPLFDEKHTREVLQTATPVEMVVIGLFNRGMSIFDIKDLLFEIYGYRISAFSISMIINRLENEYTSGISGF